MQGCRSSFWGFWGISRLVSADGKMGLRVAFLRRKGGDWASSFWLAASTTRPEQQGPMLPGLGLPSNSGAPRVGCPLSPAIWHPVGQRYTKQLAPGWRGSGCVQQPAKIEGIALSRPQGCGGTRGGRRVPQGRQAKEIPPRLFSVGKTEAAIPTNLQSKKKKKPPRTYVQDGFWILVQVIEFDSEPLNPILVGINLSMRFSKSTTASAP